MKIYHKGPYQYWYDTSTRCWFFAEFDAEENQVSESENAATKGEVERHMDYLISQGVSDEKG